MGRRWYIQSGCRQLAEIVHHGQWDKRSQVWGCSQARSVIGDGERTEWRSNEERKGKPEMGIDDQTLLLLSWLYYHCHCTWYLNVPKNQGTEASSWLLVCLMFGWIVCFWNPLCHWCLSQRLGLIRFFGSNISLQWNGTLCSVKLIQCCGWVNIMLLLS